MRTDPHSRANLVPSDYTHIHSFAYGSEGSAPFQVDRLIELRRSARFFRKPSGKGGCDVCGAHFLMGDVFVHVPTGEHIVVGWECADAICSHGALADEHAAVEAGRVAAKRAGLAELERKRKEEAAESFLAEIPGLREALALDHPILRDLAGSLRSWGGLTGRQVDLALKLAADLAQPKAEVPVSDKRLVIEGVVKSTKTSENWGFGSTLKMLVEVETEAGSFRLFGTVPDSLLDGRLLIGARVQFSAKVERSRDDSSFGFFSRPTKAVRLSEGVEAAR